MADGEYLEGGDSISPGSRTYRHDGATGTHPFYVAGDQETIEAVVRDLVGYNEEPDPLDGTIRRHLPRQHPKDPALWAAQVLEVSHGVPTMEAARSAQVGPRRSVVPRTLDYPEAKVTVGFEQRPYNLLSDSEISVENGVWVDLNGNSAYYKYATEHLRFCRVQETFTPQVLTAQQGGLMFARGTNAPPHRTHIQSSPRLDYPEFTLEITHYQVPYRWLWSRRSYYKRLAGRLNFNAMDLENYHFEPSELAFEGYSFEDFWPPFSTTNDQTAALLNERLVNMKLRFRVAYRVATDPPNLPNGNWQKVRDGHNCQASFATRQFHYVCSFDPAAPNNPAGWRPLQYAAPLELLWTDPDLPQPNIGALFLGDP